MSATCVLSLHVLKVNFIVVPDTPVTVSRDWFGQVLSADQKVPCAVTQSTETA